MLWLLFSLLPPFYAFPTSNPAWAYPGKEGVACVNFELDQGLEAALRSAEETRLLQEELAEQRRLDEADSDRQSEEALSNALEELGPLAIEPTEAELKQELVKRGLDPSAPPGYRDLAELRRGLAPLYESALLPWMLFHEHLGRENLDFLTADRETANIFLRDHLPKTKLRFLNLIFPKKSGLLPERVADRIQIKRIRKLFHLPNDDQARQFRSNLRSMASSNFIEIDQVLKDLFNQRANYFLKLKNQGVIHQWFLRLTTRQTDLPGTLSHSVTRRSTSDLFRHANLVIEGFGSNGRSTGLTYFEHALVQATGYSQKLGPEILSSLILTHLNDLHIQVLKHIQVQGYLNLNDQRLTVDAQQRIRKRLEKLISLESLAKTDQEAAKKIIEKMDQEIGFDPVTHLDLERGGDPKTAAYLESYWSDFWISEFANRKSEYSPGTMGPRIGIELEINPFTVGKWYRKPLAILNQLNHLSDGEFSKVSTIFSLKELSHWSQLDRVQREEILSFALDRAKRITAPNLQHQIEALSNELKKFP